MKPLLAHNEGDVVVTKDNDNLTVDENNIPNNDQIETIKESSEPVSILSAPKPVENSSKSKKKLVSRKKKKIVATLEDR